MNRNYLLIFWFLLLVFITSCRHAEISLSELKCEYIIEPVIDIPHPRLSWQLMSNERAQHQTAYRILVSSSAEKLDEEVGDMWDTGKRISDETVNITYQGAALQSNATYYWKVMSWDQDDRESDWSESSAWMMGLMNDNEWRAQWIGFDEAWSDTTIKTKPLVNGMKRKKDYRPLPCPYLRKDFTIEKPIKDAFIHITAMGIYELYINGQRVSEDYFRPGWTDYNKRIYYNTYNVYPYLHEGENTIGVILADGWYAGNMADRGQYYYGKKLRLSAQINIKYTDGSEYLVPSDGGWKANYGPILEADMQGGETYDARLELDGWNKPGYVDTAWKPVTVADTAFSELRAYPGKPVVESGVVVPVEFTEREPGVWIVDMGQNFAGTVSLTTKGQAGDSITLRYAENLDTNGGLFTRNLRTARCIDTYVMKGSDTETWTPRFTYHGYRYIEVRGYPGDLSAGGLTGIVLRTDLEETGSFSCSNELINKIQSNIFWSQRSNYFEVPTDCPQRDERLGWLGDAQLFMKTAAYNMDIAPFYKKWLADVADAQYEDGHFPSTAPKVYKRVAAGWGDAAVICPWQMFNSYNDTLVLRQYYNGMVRWMDYITAHSKENISEIGSFGDWQNIKSETREIVVSTAYYKHCADLMASIATSLNLPEDAKKFQSLSEDIASAFDRQFLDDSVFVKGCTQTGYLLGLSFDLIPEELKPLVAVHLVKSIKDQGMTTGILGTRELLYVLTDMGRIDLAYELLESKSFPSWGHQIENGATTIWERWDGFSYKDGFNKDSTNSFNHYAFGSIGEWFYTTVAGIKTDGPGYKHIIIDPRPGDGLSHAQASYKSIRGIISSGWKIEHNAFNLTVDIPANTDAIIYLPSLNESEIIESNHPLMEAEGIIKVEQKGMKTSIHIGSGHYEFRCPLKA